MSTGLQFLPWHMAWTQLKLYFPWSFSINSASIFVQLVISNNAYPTCTPPLLRRAQGSNFKELWEWCPGKSYFYS